MMAEYGRYKDDSCHFGRLETYNVLLETKKNLLVSLITLDGKNHKFM